MNQTEMLGQMCRKVLSETDIKAICKSRGLPAQAASSRSLLESLFLSDVGVADAFGRSTAAKSCLLHLLAAIGKPVDVAFFRGLEYACEPPRRVLRHVHPALSASVFERERAAGPPRHPAVWHLPAKRATKKTQMERWQLALPAQLPASLPPLIDASAKLAGEGALAQRRGSTKLKTVLGHASADNAKGDKLEIADRELRWAASHFVPRTQRVAETQLARGSRLEEKKERQGRRRLRHCLRPKRWSRFWAPWRGCLGRCRRSGRAPGDLLRQRVDGHSSAKADGAGDAWRARRPTARTGTGWPHHRRRERSALPVPGRPATARWRWIWTPFPWKRSNDW